VDLLTCLINLDSGHSF